jgi:hypothetical protein
MKLCKEKYTVAWYYWTAAFLHWIAMPLTMLVLANHATCEGTAHCVNLVGFVRLLDAGGKAVIYYVYTSVCRIL